MKAPDFDDSPLTLCLKLRHLDIAEVGWAWCRLGLVCHGIMLFRIVEVPRRCCLCPRQRVPKAAESACLSP